ncbi:hypothetical protein CXG81DRAFT_14208, partial [Caulochytrium protostelioides]
MSVGLEQFCKNRYPNVWPYNTNRVKLPTEDRDPRTPDTDARTYINASHIAVKTRHGVRRYIATQAPMKDTALDFWRMVWNERVLLVLMVTQEQERGRSQCYRYWPADPVPASQTTADGGHGDHSGQGGHSGPAAGAVAGEGAAASESSSSSTSSSRSHRIVYHFQHMTWLDCSIPSRVDTLDWFVCLSHIVRTEHRRYMSDELDGPMLVHCTAGCGRTGTVIAADILLTRDLASDAPNVVYPDTQAFTGGLTTDPVMEVVDQLRSQRMCLVQNTAQFAVLYELLFRRYA